MAKQLIELFSHEGGAFYQWNTEGQGHDSNVPKDQSINVIKNNLLHIKLISNSRYFA